jgi:hypothetical protein
MRAGIEALRNDDSAFNAFTLANRAMLMQQSHASLRRGLDDAWEELPADYVSIPGKVGFWRSFQLGFFLLNIPGLVAEGDPEQRDLVDLIWFPTGGGKTEAYLALTAFVIFYSRLRKTASDGCQVLMRYTLRLLTSQQFQRASSLICACELLRRSQVAQLGEERITIGLWVGMSLTPNDETDALRKLNRLARKSDAENPFQLLACPWCGTELDDARNLGYREHQGRQIFVCPSGVRDKGCPFTTAITRLPITVVDESVYQSPPSLLIGTVDKFAMLAWRERAGRIFEVGGGPKLIIQDELHLISGPLGSLVGLYEPTIDYMCSRGGRRPKIIASTATIRNASAQCRALYDRPMSQFPPPGLDASDSFFAYEDRTSTGRMYVGFLPTASSSPLTAQIRSVVALQQGVPIVAADAGDSTIDPYWTLVQYFSSLKELGRAATFISADIPEFLPTMHRRYELAPALKRWMNTSEELTSRKNEDEIPKILRRLEDTYKTGAKFDEQALDTVLATNMISVGVDVNRLGLMMIVTQPKGTSEYIQASSRVGRSSSAPGLVFTLYNAGRPRDRSHYEQFRSYHDAFYRYVEPTSVTPFAPPAMDRALHAVLVIAARHIAKWKTPEGFDSADESFAAFLEFLSDRVRSVDVEHVTDFRQILEERLTEWANRLPEAWGDLRGGQEERVLMRPAGNIAQDDEVWETPTSLRNVDVECVAEVVPRYVSAGDFR